MYKIRNFTMLIKGVLMCVTEKSILSNNLHN